MIDENIGYLQEAEYVINPLSLNTNKSNTIDRVGILLSHLLSTPANFYNDVRRTTASVANIIVWGHRGQTYEDFWGSVRFRVL